MDKYDNLIATARTVAAGYVPDDDTTTNNTTTTTTTTTVATVPEVKKEEDTTNNGTPTTTTATAVATVPEVKKEEETEEVVTSIQIDDDHVNNINQEGKQDSKDRDTASSITTNTDTSTTIISRKELIFNMDKDGSLARTKEELDEINSHPKSPFFTIGLKLFKAKI